MDGQSKPQPLTEEQNSMGVAEAILFGQLFVNLPVLIIILGVMCSGVASLPLLERIFSDWAFLIVIVMMIGAPLVGWLWWSFSVPRWRKWALRNGVPEETLQKWGVITGLVWPKGSIFERTEFRPKE